MRGMINDSIKILGQTFFMECVKFGLNKFKIIKFFINDERQIFLPIEIKDVDRICFIIVDIDNNRFNKIEIIGII